MAAATFTAPAGLRQHLCHQPTASDPGRQLAQSAGLYLGRLPTAPPPRTWSMPSGCDLSGDAGCTTGTRARHQHQLDLQDARLVHPLDRRRRHLVGAGEDQQPGRPERPVPFPAWRLTRRTGYLSSPITTPSPTRAAPRRISTTRPPATTGRAGATPSRSPRPPATPPPAGSIRNGFGYGDYDGLQRQRRNVLPVLDRLPQWRRGDLVGAPVAGARSRPSSCWTAARSGRTR